MIDFDKLDKIEITTNESISIANWVGGNMDKFKIANPILNEGLIIFKDSDAIIYFKVMSEYKVHFRYYAHIDNSQLQELTRFDLVNVINRLAKVGILSGKDYTNNLGWVSNEDVVINNMFRDKDKDAVEKLIDRTTSLCKSTFLNVMTYAQFYKNEIQVETRRYIKKGSNKKSTGSKSHKVKLTKTYKLNVENVHLDKRVFTRRTEYWSVHGHWRKTKNGKQVWVKPYFKGNKEKVSGKTYTV